MGTLTTSTTASLVTRILHLPITSDAEAFVTVARATERVVVRLTEPGPEHRGHLCRFVVRGIEMELSRLGAAPSGHSDDDAVEVILGDQLYRARLLGCFGLAVSFASLAGLADDQGQLGERDSSTLRRLVALAEREPLQLYLPRPSAELSVMGGPQPLSAWLPPELAPGAVASIEYDLRGDTEPPPEVSLVTAGEGPALVPPQIDAFVEAERDDERACRASETHSAEQLAFTPELSAWDAPEPDVAEPDAAEPLAAWLEEETSDVFEPPAAWLDAAASGAGDPGAAGEAAASWDAAEPGAASENAWLDAAASNMAELEASDRAAVVADTVVEPPDDPLADETPAPPGVSDSVSHAPVSLEGEPRPEALPSTTPAGNGMTTDAPAAADPELGRRCLAWGAQLQGMTGPKAHGSVEKAFITAYLPLSREVADGQAPPEARAAAEKWAEGFAQSYASAFRMLHTRTRRPLMVRDVVDLGLRWMGQHPARQCQLLLVSGMRFDLGQRLNEEIERRFRGAAVCAEQSVLWTALPSNPEAQLLGFGDTRRHQRGNEPARTVPDLAPIQPFLVGNRELFKLSLVLDDLPRAGEPEQQRLERLAVRLADSIVPWMQRQPPDTLVVIFGDHGFHWQATPAGTSAAQRGGALPEQVLVPASGWLTRAPLARARVAPGVH